MDWFGIFISSAIIYAIVLIIVRVFDSDDISEVDDSMSGVSIIVTGANSGIGKQVAYSLAARGASVTLACRDIEKGNAAADYIKSRTANKYIDVQHLDLADFDSVRKFADSVQRCHILINNAGCILSQCEIESGTELTMRTNHLGPFLLTNLLLPCMINTSKKSRTESRIVFVGSKLEKKATCERGDVSWLTAGPPEYDRWEAYGNSKLCNLLTAGELDRRLSSLCSGKNSGARLTVNTVSPGMVNTGLSRFMPTWQRFLFSPFAYMLMRTPAQGADSVVHAAMSDDMRGVSGKFISNRKVISPSERAQDSELAAEVWKESERLVKWKSD